VGAVTELALSAEGWLAANVLKSFDGWGLGKVSPQTVAAFQHLSDLDVLAFEL
jgi:hypothetical protein